MQLLQSEGSSIYRDSAYTDYKDEDLAWETENIRLLTKDVRLNNIQDLI